MNDKTRGYGGRDIILPDETRRAICRASEWRRAASAEYLEMMADMAESDDSGKRVLKAELLTEIAGERSAQLITKATGSTIDFRLAQVGARKRAGCGTLLVRADHHRRRRSAVALPAAVPGDCLGKMSATPTRGRCRSLFRRGIALPASGRREGERAIAQAIVYLACAPKSNAVYTAFKAALADAGSSRLRRSGASAQCADEADERDGLRPGVSLRLMTNQRLRRRRAVLPAGNGANALIITRQTGGLRAKLAKARLAR